MGEVTPSKVLIVEDSANDLNFLGKILTEENYKIYLATNGEEALKRAEKVRPDLILLDVMMPGMNGFEVCERLKTNEATLDIPVVFLTGKTDSESIIKAFEVGGADYVTKPFNSAELLARVWTHINLVRNTRALAKKIEEINQLMQMVSHDLSNQIFGITGILEIIESGMGEADLKNYLPMLQNAADNSMSILELIKEMVFFEDRLQDWDLTSIVLKKSLVSAIEPLVVKYKDKKIRVDWDDIPDDLCVLAHENSLTQSVLPNVLSNAFKFSHPESSIEIKTRVEGDKVILTITDHGIGIPKDFFPKLFTFDKSILQKGTLGEPSVGYGLPLIKKFMNAYGGTVSYESPPDGESAGTRCILTFNQASFSEANL